MLMPLLLLMLMSMATNLGDGRLGRYTGRAYLQKAAGTVKVFDQGDSDMGGKR